MARVVIADTPHHVTQRGNRRQKTFFEEDDYERYKRLLATWCARRGVSVWAYCLMPNHVHLILTPGEAPSLARAVGEVHRRYTLAVNEREGWRGYLWQGRFASYPMDSRHLLHAARYVLLNPVRAGLAKEATGWAHSSIRAHLTGQGDGLVDPRPLGCLVDDWVSLLEIESPSALLEQIRRHQRTGRPAGTTDFVQRLEALVGRPLLPRKPGRKPKNASK